MISDALRRRAALLLGGLVGVGCSDDATESGTAALDPPPEERPMHCDSRPNGRKVVDLVVINEGGFALLSDGTLWCWSSNASYVCPSDVSGPTGFPTKIERLPCIDMVEAENRYAGAVALDGRAWAWGEGSNGELIEIDPRPTWMASGGSLFAWGDGERASWWGEDDWLVDSPEQPADFPWGPVDAVAVGATHACFTRAGELFCLGYNGYGQLGDGTRGRLYEARTEPTRAMVSAPVVQAQVGGSRSYALDDRGRLWMWGSDSPPEEPYGPVPAIWEELPPLVGFDRGGYAGCGWTAEHHVWCWGSNPSKIFHPDLGGGFRMPVRVPDLEPALKVSTDTHSPLCSLKTDGTAWCRGGSAVDPDNGAATQLRFIEKEDRE
jgi:Regulator of chromosome condensation (RCC1) repeat